MGVTGGAAMRADSGLSQERVTASTILDPDSLPLLLDHRVGGSLLLPTALQLGLVMAAIRSRVKREGGVGRALSLTAITVEDPVLLVPGSPCTVRVEGVLPSAAGTGRFAIRSTVGLRHLTLHATVVSDDPGSPGRRSSVSRLELPGAADLVYPPMFHGPAFQVIDRFARLGDSVVTQRREGLPSWDCVVPGSGQVAQLIELLLQSCGVWELTQSGRMMRPLYVECLLISPRVFEPLAGARAEVWPSERTPSGFDGEVLDVDNGVLLHMTGYRPVELGPASHMTAADLQTVQPTDHIKEPLS